MASMFTLLSSLLLISATLAAPSSLEEAQLAGVPRAPLKNLRDSHHENPVLWIAMNTLAIEHRRDLSWKALLCCWTPTYARIDDRFPVSPCDEFEASIKTHSPTSATVIFHHNTRTNQTDFVQEVNGPGLSQQDVGWGVGFLKPEAFKQFSSVAIDNVHAKDMKGNRYTAKDVTIVTNLKPDNEAKVYTTVSPRSQIILISRSAYI